MLVLSRKQGQMVELPEAGVVVHVIGVRGSRVQLGFEAPAEISINRVEKGSLSNAMGSADSRNDTVDRTQASQTPGPGDPMQEESQRIGNELMRMETEIATLATLSASSDRQQASQIAADSIQRLRGIKRSLRMMMSPKSEQAQPIAELVKVRSDVLQQLRHRQDSELDSPSERETDFEVKPAVESMTFQGSGDSSNRVRETPMDGCDRSANFATA